MLFDNGIWIMSAYLFIHQLGPQNYLSASYPLNSSTRRRGTVAWLTTWMVLSGPVCDQSLSKIVILAEQPLYTVVSHDFLLPGLYLLSDALGTPFHFLTRVSLPI